MNKKSSLSIDELNQHIIDYVTKAMNAFCFGEYKEELQYPVVMTRKQIKTPDSKSELIISVSLNKTEDGLLRNSSVTVTMR